MVGDENLLRVRMLTILTVLLSLSCEVFTQEPSMAFIKVETLKNCEPTLGYLVERYDRIKVEFMVENPNATFKLTETVGMAIRVYTSDRSDDFLVCLPDYLDCPPEYDEAKTCNCKNISSTGYVGFTVQATWDVLTGFSGGQFEAAWENPSNPFTGATGSVIVLTDPALQVPEIRNDTSVCSDAGASVASSSSALSGGAVGGIVAACVAVAVVVGIAFYIVVKKKKQAARDRSVTPDSPERDMGQRNVSSVEKGIFKNGSANGGGLGEDQKVPIGHGVTASGLI